MTHALGKPDLEANLRIIVSVTIAAWLAAAGAAFAAPSGGQQQKHHWSKMSVSQIIAVQRRSIRQDWKVITTWQQSRWRVLAAGADITVMAADMKALMIPPPANVRWHEQHMQWTKRELRENLRALARRGRGHESTGRSSQGRPFAVDSCLNSLLLREGGYNPHIWNGGYVGPWDSESTHGGSGAYGGPQALPGNKMASAGPDWADNIWTQIRWMIGYVDRSYGGSCAALAHSYAYGWY